jgi:xanthine dehydrogenase YagR molybdenum-binding subunit
MAEVGEVLPLQDDRVRYHGQCVALVVADTLAAARAGARRVVVRYGEVDGADGADDPRPVFTLDEAGDRLAPVRRAGIAPGRLSHGDAHADYAASDVRVDATCHAAPPQRPSNRAR